MTVALRHNYLTEARRTTPEPTRPEAVPAKPGAFTIRHQGILLVLSGPSGTGKTTLACRLVGRDRGLVRSVSVTTRSPRPEEKNGKDYVFVSETSFEAMLRRRDLLEHTEVFGHRYGTPRAIVEDYLRRGADVLLVLDGQGRRQLAERHPDNVVSVFLLPPSLAELTNRLAGRERNGNEAVMRLAAVQDEVVCWQEYDYVLVNDDQGESQATLEAILCAERSRAARQAGLKGLIDSWAGG